LRPATRDPQPRPSSNSPSPASASALAEAVSASVSQITLATLFTLVPAAVVVLAPYCNLPSANRLLAPAILGLAGALLLLPFTQPATLPQAALYALVLAAAVVVALASIWLHRLLASITLLDAALVCSLTTTVAFAALYLTNRTPWTVSPQLLTTEALKSLAFDLPQLLLLLWLLRELPPTRLAARYLVVPLLTVLEGFVLLRPELTLRSLSGAALLTIGAWRLLTAHEPDEEPRLSLK
jgi:drug/metabolite transporter (DMT)-like permease